MAQSTFKLWGMLVLFMHGMLTASPDTVCHLVIDTNILSLDGTTYIIPTSMVGIAPQFVYEAPDITAVSSKRETPAIVFVIDDSGSMMQNDKDANRYKVTKEILDDIYSNEPSTQVAVVTFRNWLAWDWRENSQFQRIRSPFAWNDSYFPLTPLDSVFTDGEKGIDKIKGLFELDQWLLLQSFHSDSTERSRPQRYNENGEPIPSTQSNQGTDITLAFTAAKDALLDCTVSPERQFIVFLSDGFHGGVDVEMEDSKLEYIEGEDLPATYTIFLGDSVKEPPEQLLTMIDNIRDNGYSNANPHSELWSIESSHDTLLSLMQQEIVSKVYAPLKIASDATIGTSNAESITENSITFQTPIPLEPESTIVSLSLVFPLEETGGEKVSDTTITSQLILIREENASLDRNSGFSAQCYERDMTLSSNGFPITSYIRNAQTALTAAFTLEGIATTETQSGYVYSSSQQDSIEMSLLYEDEFFSGTFNRQNSETSIQGDDTLQHDMFDSIAITWRHPYLSLDTLSRVYPVIPYDPVTIVDVYYRDTDRNGTIDAIAVKTDRSINESEFDNLDSERLIVPSIRSLTYDSIERVDGDSGFVIKVSPKNGDTISTTTLPGDTLRITAHDIGPFADFIETGTHAIKDGIAPVIIDAQFISEKEGDTLRVEFSESTSEIPSGYPFKFSTADGIEYSMNVKTIGTDDDGVTVSFQVISVTAPDGIPVSSDSIWIDASSDISDTAGNIQKEPNRKIGLGITVPEVTFSIGALRNPVDRQNRKTLVVPGWKKFEGGTVIAVMSDFPVRDITDAIEEMHVRIYDSVGNLLAYDPENQPYENVWYIHWNGTNRYKRNVGNGVYCAVITIVAVNGDKRVEVVESVKVAFK